MSNSNESKMKYQHFGEDEKREPLHISLPDTLRAKVREIAFKEHESMSLWCREAIEEKIEAIEKKQNN